MDAMSQRRSARALLGAPRATLRATTSYLTSIIRCPYYGEDLASVTPILPTTPTSLIAANKRDYLPDACFYTGTYLFADSRVYATGYIRLMGIPTVPYNGWGLSCELALARVAPGGRPNFIA